MLQGHLQLFRCENDKQCSQNILETLRRTKISAEDSALSMLLFSPLARMDQSKTSVIGHCLLGG